MTPQIALLSVTESMIPTVDFKSCPAKLRHSPVVPPAVVSIVRPMHPTSKAYLVIASDMKSYVMKGSSRMDQNALSQQACEASLTTHFAMPVAQWFPLHVSSEVAFSYAHMLDHGTEVAGNDPPSRTYFGSQIPCEGESLYEYLPTNVIRRSAIRNQFARMATFDLWIGRRSPRQYVAYGRNGLEGLSLYFIGDNLIPSQATGLGIWDGKDRNPYQIAYEMNANIEVVDQMFNDISNVSRDTLERLFSTVPECCESFSSVKITINGLCERREELLSQHMRLRAPYAQ